MHLLLIGLPNVGKSSIYNILTNNKKNIIHSKKGTTRDWHFDYIEDYKDYISKAVKFSSDLDYLSQIRMNLREKALKSPVFDAERFSEHFSNMLWNIWKNFVEKKK